MNFDFDIQRDYETKPYLWISIKDGKKVEEPAEILAFYKVYLNKNFEKSYSFEIRKDQAGNIIFDHDDTLPEELYSQKVTMKEVNELCGRIFEKMHKDYF